jgi:hypothetical protein
MFVYFFFNFLVCHFLILVTFAIIFLFVFVDIGVFSIQMLPLIASGRVNSLAQRIAFETSGAHQASLDVYTNGPLSYNETISRLKQDYKEYSTLTSQFETSLQHLRRECYFTCFIVDRVVSLMYAPRNQIKYFNGLNGSKRTEFNSLREHEFNFIAASKKLSEMQKEDFKASPVIPEYNYVLDNSNVATNVSNEIQTIYIGITFGKSGFIAIFSVVLIILLVLSVVPFFFSFYEMKLKRFKSLILFDELEFNRIFDQIYSNIKARDILNSDNHKQRSAKYFANLETSNSFLNNLKVGIFGKICLNLIFAIFCSLMILFSVFIIYGFYFYMYHFIASDIKCSGDRLSFSSRVQFLVQEMQRFPSNASLYSAELSSNLDYLQNVQRGILQGDPRLGCVASNGRYFRQDNLMNQERCTTNSSVSCLSVNALLQWYRNTAKQLQTATSIPLFQEFKTNELNYVYPLLIESQNLFLEEGVVYSDIMFNTLTFVCILSIVLLMSLYFGLIVPLFENIENQNETTKRMLSMVPLKTVFTHHPIRDFFNSELFNQIPQPPEYKEEAQLYWNVLEYGLNPIIIFRKQNDQLVIIHINK